VYRNETDVFTLTCDICQAQLINTTPTENSNIVKRVYVRLARVKKNENTYGAHYLTAYPDIIFLFCDFSLENDSEYVYISLSKTEKINRMKSLCTQFFRFPNIALFLVCVFTPWVCKAPYCFCMPYVVALFFMIVLNINISLFFCACVL